MPIFSSKIKLIFNQEKEINFIPYTENIIIEYPKSKFCEVKINIKDYPENPITSCEKLSDYMEYLQNFNKNKIKSARK